MSPQQNYYCEHCLKDFGRGHHCCDCDTESETQDKTMTTATIALEISLDQTYHLLEAFSDSDRPLGDKWYSFFKKGMDRYREQGYDNGGGIVHTMSLKDARALRNLAHRAARHYASMYGESNDKLEGLRDDLTRDIDGTIA